jgi:hypothetical protein
MKRLIFILIAVAGLGGCVTSNPNSEVMVDTSSKTKKSVPDGASPPGDAERMADPFLMGN